MAYKNKEDQAKASRRHYEANREKMIARALKYKREINQQIRDYTNVLKSSTPCTDCGNKYPFYVMDFDHISNDKEFTIGRSSKRTSLDRLKKEIAKCEIVCANCHRIRTYTRKHCGIAQLVRAADS